MLYIRYDVDVLLHNILQVNNIVPATYVLNYNIVLAACVIYHNIVPATCVLYYIIVLAACVIYYNIVPTTLCTILHYCTCCMCDILQY